MVFDVLKTDCLCSIAAHNVEDVCQLLARQAGCRTESQSTIYRYVL